MTEEEVLNFIKENFPDVEVYIPEHQNLRVHVKLEKDKVEEVAKFLKENNFRHLSFITCNSYMLRTYKKFICLQGFPPLLGLFIISYLRIFFAIKIFPHRRDSLPIFQNKGY